MTFVPVMSGQEFAAAVIMAGFLGGMLWTWAARHSNPSLSSEGHSLPESHSLKVLAALISLSLLVGIAEDVLHHGPLTLADAAIETKIVGHIPVVEKQTFAAIGWLGSLPIMAALLVVIAALLGWKRNWTEMAGWIATIVSTLCFSVALKVLIQRPRPAGSLATLNDSFPSGHAMIALVAYGMICHLLRKLWSPHRSTHWITAGLTLLIVVIGVSRLYMGDHYPSDILAGYAAGGLCLSLAVMSLTIVSSRSQRL